MIVKDIIKDYLELKGFDGLYNDNECGCENSDLIPCDEDFRFCEPGYKTKCIPGQCNADGDCPFHIGAKKESCHD